MKGPESIREKISNGPWGAVYVTSQGDKYSMGKLFILPSGLTIKKQGEWLQRSDPEVKRKDRSLLLDAIPENANIGAANTFRVALLIVIQSYLQNRGRGSVEG